MDWIRSERPSRGRQSIDIGLASKIGLDGFRIVLHGWGRGGGIKQDRCTWNDEILISQSANSIEAVGSGNEICVKDD